MYLSCIEGRGSLPAWRGRGVARLSTQRTLNVFTTLSPLRTSQMFKAISNYLWGSSQPAPVPTANAAATLGGIEWRCLQEFRSHRERLESRTQYRPFDPSQGFRSAEFENAIEFFDSGLRQLLTMGDLGDLVQDKLKTDRRKAEEALQHMCSALNRFTSIDLPDGLQLDGRYPKLEHLLDILQGTRWNFELVKGRDQVLFKLNSEYDAVIAWKEVEKFNNFFTQSLQRPQFPEIRRQEARTSETWNSESRRRTFSALDTLMCQISQEYEDFGSDCENHRVLVKLPDRNIFDLETIGRSSDLEFFISTGSKTLHWHSCYCDIISQPE